MHTIRIINSDTELMRFQQLENAYHVRGKTHSGGDTLRLVIEDDGEWVALMVWGSACFHLKPRDTFIGWPASLQAERLKLVVNNRRFTILAKPGEKKNLASRCLGLAVRRLPELWQAEHGYRPLLAETFCDSTSSSSGTCYKAANWIPLGLTRGFTRVNRNDNDFFTPNGVPKSLWIKPLHPQAVSLLNASELPADYIRGAEAKADGILPIGRSARESLYEALRHVHDTRTSNRTFAIGAMLSILAMAVMSGANTIKAVARFAQHLDMSQRHELCLPAARNKAGRLAAHEYKVPSYVTLYNFLKGVDRIDFAWRLSLWLTAEASDLPPALTRSDAFLTTILNLVDTAQTTLPEAKLSA